MGEASWTNGYDDEKEEVMRTSRRRERSTPKGGGGNNVAAGFLVVALVAHMTGEVCCLPSPDLALEDLRNSLGSLEDPSTKARLQTLLMGRSAGTGALDIVGGGRGFAGLNGDFDEAEAMAVINDLVEADQVHKFLFGREELDSARLMPDGRPRTLDFEEMEKPFRPRLARSIHNEYASLVQEMQAEQGDTDPELMSFIEGLGKY